MQKIAFLADETHEAQRALDALSKRYGSISAAKADVIVALGGDGFMLSTLHNTQSKPLPVYGMNRGTIGFLMNEFSEENLYDRLKSAEAADINPLRMCAICDDGSKVDALAINEVSLLRAGPQAAKLKITIDGKVRMEELVCDGVIVSTSAGSTGYNYSASGPIIPLGSNVMALTAVSAYSPRHWRGGLLKDTAKIKIVNNNPSKRPIVAHADHIEAKDVTSVEIEMSEGLEIPLLFDNNHKTDLPFL